MGLCNAGNLREVSNDTLLCSIGQFKICFSCLFYIFSSQMMYAVHAFHFTMGKLRPTGSKLLSWGHNIQPTFTKHLLCANYVTGTVLDTRMSNITRPCIAKSQTTTGLVNMQSSIKIEKWLIDCQGNTAEGFSHRS